MFFQAGVESVVWRKHKLLIAWKNHRSGWRAKVKSTVTTTTEIKRKRNVSNSSYHRCCKPKKQIKNENDNKFAVFLLITKCTKTDDKDTFVDKIPLNTVKSI